MIVCGDWRGTEAVLTCSCLCLISLKHTRYISSVAEMPSNVEIKARLRHLDHVTKRARELSGSDGTIIMQHDTFFNTEKGGRLKLRKFLDGSGQLIFYERPDMGGPKLSNYSISNTNDADGLIKVLSDALGQVGQVKKKRNLYLVGQTRVHVDSVEGLGDFMELEVVMKEDQSTEEGVAIANQLMQDLGVKEEDLIEGAYMDLLLSNVHKNGC
ncbi:adenylate cyclase CyaB-like [Trichomycterus rosablanca]|uniref:adenylate cyclase CyaB-like n=1 Tax=Trichomycterus rosablanca TaxID=2290929 RepID=UPI002F357CFE